ncbi:MAG: hypothetical protein AAFV53_36340, partial [Myxococcota bacterium]
VELSQLGQFDVAERMLTESVQLSETANHDFARAQAFGALAMMHSKRGTLDAADLFSTRAIAVAESLNNAVLKMYSAMIRLKIVLQRDRLAEAEALLAWINAQPPVEFLRGAIEDSRARVALARGDLDVAAAANQRALSHLANMGTPLFMAETLDITAQIALARGDMSGANQILERIESLILPLGLPLTAIRWQDVQRLRRSLSVA